MHFDALYFCETARALPDRPAWGVSRNVHLLSNIVSGLQSCIDSPGFFMDSPVTTEADDWRIYLISRPV